MKSGSPPLEYLYFLQLYPSFLPSSLYTSLNSNLRYLINAKISRTTAVAMLYHTKCSSHRLNKKIQKLDASICTVYGDKGRQFSLHLPLSVPYRIFSVMLLKNLLLIEESVQLRIYLQICKLSKLSLLQLSILRISDLLPFLYSSVARKTVLIEILCEVILRFRSIVLLRTACCCNLIKFIHKLFESNGAVLDCICRKNCAVIPHMYRTVTTTARMQELTNYAVILTATAIKHSVIILKQRTGNLLWNFRVSSYAVVMLKDQL